MNTFAGNVTLARRVNITFKAFTKKRSLMRKFKLIYFKLCNK